MWYSRSAQCHTKGVFGEAVFTSGSSRTDKGLVGQRLDGSSGLLYYGSRYYGPALSYFISPNSVVPGSAVSSGGGAATLSIEQNSKLTVDFHESGFLTSVRGENQQIVEKGFWFQLSGQDKQTAKDPSGPENPQALSRYSYTLDNPIRYSDPAGHFVLGVNYTGGLLNILPRGVTLKFSREEFKQLLDAIKAGEPAKEALDHAVAVAEGAALGAEGGPLGIGLGAGLGDLLGTTTVSNDQAFLAWLQELYDSGGTLDIVCDAGIYLLTGQGCALAGLDASEASKIPNGAHVEQKTNCWTVSCEDGRVEKRYDSDQPRSSGGGSSGSPRVLNRDAFSGSWSKESP